MAVYNPDNPNYFDPSGQVIDPNAPGGFGPGNTTETPSSGGGSSGGFSMPGPGSPGISQSGLPGFFQNVGQFLTGSNNPFTNAMLIPAEAMAAQQWNNASTYRDLGNQAAQMANPFGDRSQYVNELSDLYKDPSSIENTPGYKFTLNQALDATQSRLRSQGFMGSAEMQNALATQAGGIADQTWNTERNALMQLAGAQFDPANAARMMMEGGELAVNAQNGALASAFAPFGPGAQGYGQGGVTINNSNNSQGGQGGGGGSQGGGSGYNPYVQGGMRGLPGDAASIMQRMISDPSSVSPGDLQLLQNLGIQTPFDTGGQDMAPGSYDTSGFGGYGDASGDPTLSGIDFGNPNWSPFNYNDVMGGPYGDLTGYGDGATTFPYDPSGSDMDWSGGDSGFDLSTLFGG